MIWLTLLAGTWLAIAGHWDAWAHRRELPDSFWTVWHLAFYTGFASLATVILGAVAIRRPRVSSWRRAIPRGYGWAVVGVGLFAAGGVADGIWHSIFGIEFQTDALLSPSHLLLATGSVLMLAAPYRASASPWARILSLTLLFAEIQFFTQYAGPFSTVYATGTAGNFRLLERELLGSYLYAAFVLGIVFTALRKPPLPRGGYLVLLTTTASAHVLVADGVALTQATLIGVAALAGLVGEVVLAWVRPSFERVRALRATAFVLPASFFLIYLGIVNARFGTSYSAHAAVGLVVTSGVAGLLLSYIALPPAGAGVRD